LCPAEITESVVVAVEPVRQVSLTSYVPDSTLTGTDASPCNNVFHGSNVRVRNAFELTVAGLLLSPQSARTVTLFPASIVPGLTCTHTPAADVWASAAPSPTAPITVRHE